MSCEASDVLATCKNLLSVLLLALASSGHSQAAADISDPVRLGIMQGFPPAQTSG